MHKNDCGGVKTNAVQDRFDALKSNVKLIRSLLADRPIIISVALCLVAINRFKNSNQEVVTLHSINYHKFIPAFLPYDCLFSLLSFLPYFPRFPSFFLSLFL